DRLKLIPTVGFTYFNIQGSNSDFKAKSGSSVAALVQLPVDSDFVFETGLEYFEAQAKLSETFGMFEIEYATLKINYLAIPLRAIYNFNQPASQGTHWFAKAGITPSYVMSAKLDSVVGSGDVKSDLNSMTYLAHFGGGADWQVAMGGRLSTDLTYNYGLNKYSKEDSGVIAGINVQVGYSIEL
ncbi:MAG: PorT family protein, partial [Moraxellaceae bacterium]|nr:PorT family protein [Pseudobdellovibrionaceae bacterium]